LIERSSLVNSDPAVGQESLARPVRARTVLAILSRNGAAGAIVYAAPFVVGLIEGEWRFALACVLSASLCASFFLFRSKLPIDEDVTRAEVLLSTASAYAIAALLMTLPFMTLGMSFTDALFEGMSGITTTGLTLAQRLDTWPFAGLFARAWLQWCGGAFFLVAALALVISPGRVARRLAAAQFEDRGILASTRARARTVLVIYATMSGCCFAILWAMSGKASEALLLTLTAVSTGGFASTPGSLATTSDAVAFSVLFFCFLSSISVSTYLLLRQRRIREFFLAGELVTLTGLVLGVSALIFVAEMAAQGLSTAEALKLGLLNSITAQSTAGFSIAPVEEMTPFSQALLIAQMMIGGDVGSTAGGLKVVRLILIAKLIYVVLTGVLMPPSAVYRLKLGGAVVTVEEISAVCALVLLYIFVQFVSWLVFAAYGYPPLGALFEVTSALSTVGLSAGITSPDLPVALKWLLSFLMWLGRVELIGVLTLLLPRTWSAKGKR
jgi:trk/ktr system potassium uptake protein